MTWVPPRFQTERTAGVPTYGPAVEKVAQRVGTPLMRWQREVSRTAGEVTPDGRMRYPIVVLLVPRRAGKTVTVLSTSIQRASIAPRRRCWYTAQTRQDAADTLRDEWVPLIAGGRYSSLIRPLIGNGRESLTMSNGSKIGVFAPGPKGVHGKDADLAVIDEAWAFDAQGGADVEGGVRPAMLTRPQRQLWVISAGGVEGESEYLLQYRELGRALVNDPDSAVYFAEYSADPEVDDLDDPATWERVHPACGETFPLDVLREERATMGAAAFNRAYLTVFTDAKADRIIPSLAWAAAGRLDVEVGPVLPVLTVEVAHDRSHAAIGTARYDAATGVTAVAVVDHRPGTAWTIARLRELQDRHRVPVQVDPRGPAGPLLADLHTARVRTELWDETRLVRASGQLHDDLVVAMPDPRVSHRHQGPLDVQAGQVQRKDAGDAWRYSRSKTAGDASAFFAALLAFGKVREAAGRPRRRLGSVVLDTPGERDLASVAR